MPNYRAKKFSTQLRKCRRA